MQTGNNNIEQGRDIRNIILSSVINFKTLSQQLRKRGRNDKPLSNLALYTLLLLKNNSSLLRNDIMKKFHVNYYDAGSALDQLTSNGLILKDLTTESLKIKSIRVKRTRYRLSLNGEIFIDDILGNIINDTLEQKA